MAVGSSLLVGHGYTPDTYGSGSTRDYYYGAWTFEAGVLVLRAPVQLRARAFANLFGVSLAGLSGDFRRYGGGVEARACTGGNVLCFFADLDVGFQELELIFDNEPDSAGSSRGMLVGPRFGLDAGGFVRVRIGAELYGHYATRALSPADTGWGGTGGLTLGLVVQL